MRKGLEMKEKELLELEEKLNVREQASPCTSSNLYQMLFSYQVIDI